MSIPTRELTPPEAAYPGLLAYVSSSASSASYLSVNAQFARWLGRLDDDVRGLPLGDDDDIALTSFMRGFIKDGVPTATSTVYVSMSGAGSVFTMHAHRVSGSECCFFGLPAASSITDYSNAQTEPTASDERIRQILDAIPDPIFVKDEAHRWIYGNDAFSSLLNLPLEGYLGKTDYDLFPRELADVFWKMDAHVYDSDRANENEEKIVDGATGQLRTILTKKTPTRSRDGSRILVGVIRDITARVVAQETLQQQTATLTASSKMSALGEMAAGIAHEINTPLSIIELLSQQIAEDLADPTVDKDDLILQAQRCVTTVRRIARIVAGLRTFSRDGGNDAAVPTAIQGIIDDTLVLCQERFKNAGLSLHIDTIPPEWVVTCRPVEISQILLNLMNNAFDATQGTLGAWVKLGVANRGDAFELSVENSGARIPKDVEDKLFRPFFTTKDVGKGTGLGLSVSQGLARSHGGSLTLDPSSAQTRFVLRLHRTLT